MTIGIVVLAGSGGCHPQSERVLIDRRDIPELTLEQSLAIDGESHGLVPLGGLGPAVTFAGDGVVFTQNQDARIVRFAADGRMDATIGRRGSGPGEFQNVARIGWLSDTLWVLDQMERRFTFVAPDWSVAGLLPVPAGRAVDPATGESMTATPLGLHGRNAVVVALSGNAMVVGADSTGIGLMDPEGKLLRPSVRLAAAGEIPQARTAMGMTSASPFPIHPRDHLSPSGQYLVIVRTAIDTRKLSVALLRGNLDTVTITELGFSSPPVPQQVAESVTAARTGRLPKPLADEYLKQARIPAAYPPVIDVLVGDDGVVCLALQPLVGERRFVMLTKAGVPYGEFTLPFAERPVLVASDFLITVRRNSDDVESVIKYRLHSSESGGKRSRAVSGP